MNEQEKNLKIVKETFEAFGRRDIRSVIRNVADTVDWRWPVTNGPGPISWAKPRQNRQGVEKFFKELLRSVTPIELKPIRFTAQDDRVVVEGADHSKATATGLEYLVNWVMVIALRDGKITIMHDYFDTAEIIRALEGRVSRAA